MQRRSIQTIALGVLALALTFWIVGVALPEAANSRRFADSPVAPPEFRVARSIVDYRESGSIPYWEAHDRPKHRARWSPEEILELLERFPDYYVELGSWSVAPTGSVHHVEVGRVLNEVQALGKTRGIDTARIIIPFRNDVMSKRPPNWPDCSSCVGSGECTDSCGWEGTMKDAPFDPDWIMTIPRSEHRWSVEQIWGGDDRKDPWHPRGEKRWSAWVDRIAFSSPNSERRVAALYGHVKDLDPSERRRDYAIGVTAVVMDLRNPAYRTWSVKRLLADLSIMGVDPGERAVLLYGYKPGWHTYFDGPPSGDRCFVPESHMWTGPANPCVGPRHPPGGPFARTPYGPGEFEEALNSMIREMRAGLVEAGLEGVKLMTSERPPYGKHRWTVLDQANRSAPWLIGERIDSCDRRNLARPADPFHCR